jgi:ribonuclease Z
VIAPELPFPIRYLELTEAREQHRIGPFVIDAYKVNHNVTCYGYAISIPRTGKFDPVRAKAQNIPLKFWNPLQKGQTMTENGVTYTPDMVLGGARRGLKVAYCTDTRPVPVIAEYAAGADLFICEGMYGEPDKMAKARENKHMTMYEAAELAKRAQPREMWLTHYSPSLNHPEDYMDDVKKIFPAAKAAGQYLEEHFGQKHLYLPFSFDYDEIMWCYQTLCHELDIPFPDYLNRRLKTYQFLTKKRSDAPH